MGPAAWLVAIGLLLGGCGARVIERERPIAFGNAGEGWQLVLASEFALIDPAAPEYARRDASFGNPPVVGSAAALYPGQPPSSLLRSRRIHLDRDADRPTFFFPERHRSGRFGGRGTGRGYRHR
ncbi:MAG: hypothetical protein AAGF47_10670 [Planctomycetota bacterium]